MQTTTLFPDILFTGTLQVSANIHRKIISNIKELQQSGASTNTHFGWISNPDVPLKNNLSNLQMLVGRTFVDNIYKSFGKRSNKKINAVQPYIASIKPEHTYTFDVNPSYWYNGIIWLQTTDKGNSLYIENTTGKRYTTPWVFQPPTHIEEPAEYKYAFWPSYYSAGLTPNYSMIDTLMFNIGFTFTKDR